MLCWLNTSFGGQDTLVPLEAQKIAPKHHKLSLGVTQDSLPVDT